ncbi:four helix bundle protein [Rhodocaloribacter litoris]|uniref:four helix bundle protein n=1 Tax=Rhodocaloribacter litoris TaxID=2558931 RepID=UPI001E3025AE|nr:four helix bundle protein [Rhodocaloribacter litoris]QXD15184.1 four helix bundle protein [Rhodocaloribacter litoris]GIV61503.1 MAG: four helix bundle protein [Rhodothermaceae bacterium]
MVRHFRELRVYQQALEASMHLFVLSKAWPVEERYALTDQIRRSSRSVCANIAEAWRKRRYPNHFVSKLTDADAEVAETQSWLDMALRCGYLSAEQHGKLDATYEAIASGLVGMMQHRDTWCGPARLREEPVPYSPDSAPEID